VALVARWRPSHGYRWYADPASASDLSELRCAGLPITPVFFPNGGCQGKKAALQQAVAGGFDAVGLLQSDASLEPLRSREDSRSW
jgi:hypothetical protein